MRGLLLLMPLSPTAVVMVLHMSDDRITPTPTMHRERSPMTLDELANLTRDGNARVLADIATTNGNVRVLGQKFDDLTVRVERLETKVFGAPPAPLMPRPPTMVHAPTSCEMVPTTGEEKPRSPSIVEKQEAQAGDIAELSGRLLTLESINKQQSRAAGLAMPDAPLWRKAATLLLSRKGVELVIAVATLGAVAFGCERSSDALRKVQDAVQHMPATEAPR